MSKLDDMYYVYKHYLNDMLFYIGKGIDDRAFDFVGRSRAWKRVVRENTDKVRVEIVGYFVSEADAYEVEKLLIKKYGTNNSRLTNHVYNPIKENILESALENKNKDGSVSINKQLFFENVIEYGMGGTPAYILNRLKIESSISSIIIDNNSRMLIKARDEMVELGYKVLLIMPEEKYDEELSYNEKVNINYFKKNKKLPKDYDYLIVDSYVVEKMSLNVDEVNSLIINTSNIHSRNKTLMSLKGKITTLAYKSRDYTDSVRKIKIPKEFLNRYLTVEDKEELVKGFDIRNVSGRQVKWPTIKRIAKSSGYAVEDLVRTVDGVRRGVSVIKYIEK